MGAKPSLTKFDITYELKYPMDTGKSFIMFYINLEKRTDRRREIEEELNRMDLKPYIRFRAIENKKGAIGCTQSHIQCLKLGLESGADHILVFEDDFLFTQNKDTVKRVLQSVIQTNYDVFLLGFATDHVNESLFATNHDMFKRAIKVASTHGYMVTKRYLPTLLENFEASVKLLKKTGKEPQYALDQYWKQLQVKDNFLCHVNGPLGFQRDGYSDINGEMVQGEFDRRVRQYQNTK